MDHIIFIFAVEIHNAKIKYVSTFVITGSKQLVRKIQNNNSMSRLQGSIIL